MMTDKDTPKEKEREDAIRALIRQTVAAMGDTAPDALPHLVRSRLQDQISGDADLDKLLKDVLHEQGEARK